MPPAQVQTSERTGGEALRARGGRSARRRGRAAAEQQGRSGRRGVRGPGQSCRYSSRGGRYSSRRRRSDSPERLESPETANVGPCARAGVGLAERAGSGACTRVGSGLGLNPKDDETFMILPKCIEVSDRTHLGELEQHQIHTRLRVIDRAVPFLRLRGQLSDMGRLGKEDQRERERERERAVCWPGRGPCGPSRASGAA